MHAGVECLDLPIRRLDALVEFTDASAELQPQLGQIAMLFGDRIDELALLALDPSEVTIPGRALHKRDGIP